MLDNNYILTSGSFLVDKIDNDNFISGIEYLVNEGIIKVSLTDTTNNTSIPEI